MAFSTVLLEHWQRMRKNKSSNHVFLTGRALTLADVVQVARHGRSALLSEGSEVKIERSALAIEQCVTDGKIIYGVNTGFGGSADTRTSNTSALQRELIRMLQSGLTDSDHNFQRTNGYTSSIKEPLSYSAVQTNCLPESWVRATMLIRLNSLAAGASGVRFATFDTLLQLLQHDILPKIPLRGSISASGDLSPLAYVGAAVQGKPSSIVSCGPRESRQELRADVALAQANIVPIVLQAKEGLAIVNGTAPSAAVGSFAIHEAMSLAALAQVLTAMSVEALAGTDESFDPFFSGVRPHPGQIDAAATIRGLFQGSTLAKHTDGTEESSLRQDRYSIRTAPQWLGPVLEDLELAYQQTVTELNSVTDNPLVDVVDDVPRIINGGNFQARSITSATEKVRQACQSIGRMLFTQCTELINPVTNRGLPPNLVFDEPSESYLWKGTDILIAALTSELGFLANPVGTHVQTAEMGNQALNSLALISARYAIDSVSILSHLSAAHLVALCQALDLRAMQIAFLVALEPQIQLAFRRSFHDEHIFTPEVFQICWTIFVQRIARLTTLNSDKRFAEAWNATLSLLLPIAAKMNWQASNIAHWIVDATETSKLTYAAVKAQYFRDPDASPHLGVGARRMYLFVRTTLRVPFMGNANVETPPPESVEPEDGDPAGEFPHDSIKKGSTIGDMISKVYQAIQLGQLYEEVIACYEDIHNQERQFENGGAELENLENGDETLGGLKNGRGVKRRAENRHTENEHAEKRHVGSVDSGVGIAFD